MYENNTFETLKNRDFRTPKKGNKVNATILCGLVLLLLAYISWKQSKNKANTRVT